MMLNIFTSTRLDGSMKSVHVKDSTEIRRNRTRFLKEKSINAEDTTLVQVAYNRDDYKQYFTIDDELQGDGITQESTHVSDALVVTKPGHALLLPLADCIGAVIYDPDKNILMVSHLGRHNLEQYGGSKSIEFLIDNHAVNPAKLQVWLSPAAGKESYPLYAFNNRSLHEVAVEQLRSTGIPINTIDASTIDSAKDKAFYSHSQFLKGNREDDGRFAIVAVMSN